MGLKVSDQIEEADEGHLIWYFGELGTRFERSVFGSMIDQVELTGAFSKPCSECDGTGIVDKGGFMHVLHEAKHSAMVKAETGIGAIPDETRRWEEVERDAAHAGWCKVCRGTGALPAKRKGSRGSPCRRCDGKRRAAAFNVKPGQHDIPCPDCLSTGREPITACPVTTRQESARGAPDDHILSKFAVISRRLSLVRAQRVVWFQALEAFYGDSGQRWAIEDQGRLFALYALTRSGKKLARWGEARSVIGKGSKMPKAKKNKAKHWKNPAPVPEAYPFLTLREVLRDGRDWRRRESKRYRFIGPRFPDGTRTLRDHFELRAMLGPLRATEHDNPPPVTDLTPLERIGVEVALERLQPNEHRKKLLLAAGAEALDLYFCAARAWNSVCLTGSRLRRRLARPDARAVISLRARAINEGHTELARTMLEQGLL